MTLRVRNIAPPLHVSVQLEYGVQDERTQSIGHGFVLQAVCSESGGHGRPEAPTFATVIIRVRLLTPPPQLTEHALHSVKFETSQFTSHGSVAHVLFETREGHPKPPFIAC
jgi:hypothetical protein